MSELLILIAEGRAERRAIAQIPLACGGFALKSIVSCPLLILCVPMLIQASGEKK